MKAMAITAGMLVSLLLFLPQGAARDEQEKLATLPRPANAELERLPSIAEIMQQAHRCRDAYILHVRNQLAKPDPDWQEVEKRSKDLVRMGQLLSLNKPPRGSQETWELLTSVYVARASLLGDAAQNKDKESALLHQKKLSSMCVTCHQAHR